MLEWMWPDSISRMAIMRDTVKFWNVFDMRPNSRNAILVCAVLQACAMSCHSIVEQSQEKPSFRNNLTVFFL